MAVLERNLWRVEFPSVDGKTMRLDMAAPSTSDRYDVIVTACAALSAARLSADPFTMTAELLGPYSE